MDTERSVFWDDLAHDLTDPQFLREYVAESIRIATIDQIVNELDAAREAAGLSKAGLARAISSEPATIRRLFSAATSIRHLAPLPRLRPRSGCVLSWNRWRLTTGGASLARFWRAVQITLRF